jgi:hypothetical protein
MGGEYRREGEGDIVRVRLTTNEREKEVVDVGEKERRDNGREGER